MPVPDLFPIPFPTLLDRLDRELAAGDAVYTLRRRDWWTPAPDAPLTGAHFGRRLATPVGPASGPHTQLAQNLVLGFLGGARFFELKTVQVNDALEIPRPCIFVPHVGYNVEWSQELRVAESADEYIKGWMLVHFLLSELGPGLWPGDPGVIFDFSLGYDLAGIQSDKIKNFVAELRDAGPRMAALRAELPARLSRWAAVPVPTQVSGSVTLSTFHGCPAHEIAAIASETLDWGLDTVIKLNPTLLGYDRVRALLDQMGYDASLIRLDPAAFDKDLQWDQLLEMVPRLRAKAEALGLGFGLKLSNTLVMHSPEPPFGPGEMYLSGPPLHVVSMTLAAAVRAAFWDLPLTFSAGVEARNFADCVAAGLGPVTTCSDLLKRGGYGRLPRYLRALEDRMRAQGVADLEALRAKSPDLSAVAAALPADASYHRAANSAPPKKVGTTLDLLDCLTCDKCIPVCPNAANFAFPVPTGSWSPGRVTWADGAWTIAPGATVTVEKRHQIGNHADACNLCGQCDPWCPEDGGPYLAKPNLFLSPTSFEAHPERDGLLVSPDRRAITWRRSGARYHYAVEGAEAVLRTATGALRLVEDAPVACEGAGEVDLSVAVTLRLFLASFADPSTPTWLPPLPAALS